MAGKMPYALRNAMNRAYAEGRAKQFGVGPANPHASTSNKYEAWVAGNTFSGSRDSTPYGVAGWSSTWTGVTFGAGDILTNSTDLGFPATFDTVTFALAFRFASLPGSGQVLMGATQVAPLGFVGVQPDGSIIGNGLFTNLSTSGAISLAFAGAGAVQAGRDYVLHVAAQASTNTLLAWLNGAPLSPTASWFGTAAFTRPTAYAVGGAPGAPSLEAVLALAWLDQGQYITDPAKFFPAYALGAQLANPGARPGVGFGGVQTAANWNAGTNLGDGTGTWTMTGAVT